MVLQERSHGVRSQAVGVTRVMEIVGVATGYSVQSVEASASDADPQYSVVVQEERSYGRPTEAVSIERIRLEAWEPILGRGIRTNPAVAGREPEDATAVLVDGADSTATQAVQIQRIMRIVDKTVIVTIPMVETRLGANPKGAITILTERGDLVVTQTMRVGRVVKVARETAGRYLQAIETADLGLVIDPGAHPQNRTVSGGRCTAVLGDNRGHPVMTKAVWVVWLCVVAGHLPGGRIQRVQPVPGPHPRQSLTVLQDGSDVVVAQGRRSGRIVPIPDRLSGCPIKPQ